MLKIRIAGTESELRQIAHKAGSTKIRRFKRDNGKTTFAIDVQISVNDFLENLDLNSDSKNQGDTHIENKIETQSENQQFNIADIDKNNNCDPRIIQAELEELLDEISDK
ncbi:hypothetical protein [sulfur-oxidizing endosymbiont of Gigantopelta aegis]|uniref:hypothetical protein n=1 Tax=sulfur-oxidizing endosymbiont of Gigantopelta aegis TaxID=2794934 RepID=UPI0018DC476A|nr:hypothetical protein [sulfur-oxidizing endosymbiont of Gigantopelta aegis]